MSSTSAADKEGAREEAGAAGDVPCLSMMLELDLYFKTSANDGSGKEEEEADVDAGAMADAEGAMEAAT